MQNDTLSTNKLHIDSKILDRLKSAFELSTDTELADFLGVKQSTIATWKRRQSFNLELIISKCNELNLNWLFEGKGPMHLKDLTSTRVEEDQKRYMHEKIDFEPIPYWEGHEKTKVHGLDMPIASLLKSKVAFSQSWIRNELHMNWRSLFCYRMDGSSMEPMFTNGDELIINTHRRHPREGPAFLVELDKRPHVKLLAIGETGDIMISAANPRLKPMKISPEDDSLYVVGEVVCRLQVSEYL